jgi:methylmalonyl-CoA mutase
VLDETILPSPGSPDMPIAAQSARHPIRFITAAALFDGHDASINIIRRMLQAVGVEVIHLGHNRAVMEIAQAALQEDVQGIALSSYQGGHVEFFQYLVDYLREHDGSEIQIFGGGGGVIVPEEIDALQRYGVTRIYSPDDGRRLGLQGMIDDMIARTDFALPTALPADFASLAQGDRRLLARLLSAVQAGGLDPAARETLQALAARSTRAPVV